MHKPALSSSAINAAADAVCALMDGGYLCVYSRDTTGHSDFLARLTFSAKAFQPAEKGIAEANPITSDMNARRKGTAAWFQTYRRDGKTAVLKGTIGLAGDGDEYDLELSSLDVIERGAVSVNSLIYQQAKKKD